MFRSVLLSIALAAFSSLSAQAQVQTATLQTHDNGSSRDFRFYVPTHPPAHPALLLCYHGSGGTSAEMESTSGFNDLAEKYGFIVCYPQAVVIGSDRQWNVYVDDKPGHAGVNDPGAADDVVFSQDLVSYFSKKYNVDTTKMYASGLSNGAFMCYMLAVMMPKQFGSIAPVAGNMWGDSDYLTKYFGGNSFVPVRVMHTHGTADKVVDYPDPNNNPDEFIYPLASFSTRMCNNTHYSVVPIQTNIDALRFCDAPNDVVLIRQTGAGHQWNLAGFDLSGAIIRFFGLDKTSDVAPTNYIPELLCNPQPADDYVRITIPSAYSTGATISLRNIVGVEQQHLNVSGDAAIVDLRSLCNGVYSVEYSSPSGALIKRATLCVQH